MNRADVRTEMLRLHQELVSARSRIRAAQVTARETGVRMPAQEFGAVWRQVYALESALETARLRFSASEEIEAEKFIAIIRSDYPKTFAAVSSRLECSK
jgi:hypothetical protein